MKKLFFIAIFQLGLISNIFGHGTDNLGPNGGYINMPGAYHTELVPNDDGSFKVFLIDINFKNPITKDSSVEMKYIQNKNETHFNCNAFNEMYFICKSKKFNSKITKGNIEIKAIRNKVKSNVAKYPLPLELNAKKPQDNSKHDMKNM